MDEVTVYFASGGKQNTDATLELAKKKASLRNISHVVIASSSGFTAERALDVFQDTAVRLTIISLGTGTRSSFSDTIKVRLEAAGHNLCFSGDVTYEWPQIAVTTLRRFSEGIKVCVQVMLVAVEAGLIPVGQEVVAVGGSGPRGYAKGGGADTAIVIEAMKSREFFNLEDTPDFPKEERRKIKELISKPR